MATYILLGSLTDVGAETIRLHPEKIVEANKTLEAMNVKIKEQYAVLGPYDFVTIVEAPDNKTIVKVSTEISMHGMVKITTLPALPIDEFILSVK